VEPAADALVAVAVALAVVVLAEALAVEETDGLAGGLAVPLEVSAFPPQPIVRTAISSNVQAKTIIGVLSPLVKFMFWFLNISSWPPAHGAVAKSVY